MWLVRSKQTENFRIGGVFAEFELENHVPSAIRIRKFIDKRLPNICQGWQKKSLANTLYEFDQFWSFTIIIPFFYKLKAKKKKKKKKRRNLFNWWVKKSQYFPIWYQAP